jgi:hypothetical protein
MVAPRIACLAAIAVLTVALTLTPQTKRAATTSIFPSPDNTSRVVAISEHKFSHASAESRIEIHGAADELLCTLDYSSEDGEHGFGIVKALWTTDSRFFVFSLTSSGGHQAWHAPTQFYDRTSGKVRTLDDFLSGSGISKSDFRIVAPDIVRTEVWENKGVPVSIRLSRLPDASHRVSKPFSQVCSSGRVIVVESP